MEYFSSLPDCREDFYFRLCRCWLVIDTLGLNRSGKAVLTLKKAAFFDYLISNPRVFGECLSFFEVKSVGIRDFLYGDNLEFGQALEFHRFLQCALTLQDLGAVKFSKDGQDLYVVASSEWEYFSSFDVGRMRSNTLLLKPIVGKSLSVLYKSVMG